MMQLKLAKKPFYYLLLWQVRHGVSALESSVAIQNQHYHPSSGVKQLEDEYQLWKVHVLQ